MRTTGVWTAVVLVSLVEAAGVSDEDEWRSCTHDGWIAYREDGRPKLDVEKTFHACIYSPTDGKGGALKPGWDSSHEKCKEKGADLAHWKHWKELAFYYNVFQSFKQTLSSAHYFMVFVNLRDKPFPSYESYYSVFSGNTLANHSWTYDRDSMIKIQHNRFVQPDERKDLDVHCAAFRMEKNNFIDSDILYVPCDEITYKKSVFDIQNDMEHFLCRKKRTRCDLNQFSRQHITKMVGIYTHYYGTMRGRQQKPSTNLLVNRSFCFSGCTGKTTNPTDVDFFTGDWLKFWCEPGYRVKNHFHIPSQKGHYAICRDGRWIYEPCEQQRCDPGSMLTCENGGVQFKTEVGCVCDCPPPWGGETCTANLHAEDLSEVCNEAPCLNQGTCVPDSTIPEGFRCKCHGAMGKLCEYELNECSSSPCSDQALCVDQFNGYRCICDTYWQGVHCTEVTPNCQRLEDPCKNGADCYSCNLDTFKGWCEQENATNFICNCKKGYAGFDCSRAIQKQADAWQIFAIVLGCMLFIIVSLFCEIIGSRRRHDHDNLQVLLESIDGYLKQRKDIDTSKRLHVHRNRDEKEAEYQRARFRGRARARGRGRGKPSPGSKVSVGAALSPALNPSGVHDDVSGTWSSRSPGGGFASIRSTTEHGKTN